jgi:hypothetical protein
LRTLNDEEMTMAQWAYALSIDGIAEVTNRACDEVSRELEGLRWYHLRRRREALAEIKLLVRLSWTAMEYARTQYPDP